ncbi:MAG: tRNA (N(6)-L-threonylcarbamoyladenosine(37)-C(2))-methylthiotransferase MtaB [Candidatus Cloacimonetes bacterium]|nr:tRNA (N(6)-L-threonylcarbamoyladenosine(37)-C(2))-methylthiotransferase MtaB [Candidatus Cloacimonadota bacterium]
MIRVAIATLGCKTNAYESAAIAGSFPQTEYCLVPFAEEADIYIINTCTVTGRTDYKSRNLIRKALARKEQDPSVRIVVTGCFAQRNPDEIRDLGAIDLIVDNQAKTGIADLLDQPDYSFQDIMRSRSFVYRPVARMVEHSRAFQKIQDGCDYRCAYCAVPYGRGNSRSASFADVISQARLFVANGYKEIVLGGVNLGLYQDGNQGLAGVVEAFEKIDGLKLIRLSSLEPMLFTGELIERISRCSKLCPHFHIALQSGCDSVLRRMGRHYEISEFRALTARILQTWPDAAIGLDVIAGFPGETEAEFQATLDLLADLDIAYLHSFSFSRRWGTPADTMPGQIPKPEKNRRVNLLTALSDAKKRIYTRKLIQDQVPLRGVCEKVVDGHSTCLSDHFVRAYSSPEIAPGEMLSGIAAQARQDGVLLEPKPA